VSRFTPKFLFRFGALKTLEFSFFLCSFLVVIIVHSLSLDNEFPTKEFSDLWNLATPQAVNRKDFIGLDLDILYLGLLLVASVELLEASILHLL
jgi:hypothetical protein